MRITHQERRLRYRQITTRPLKAHETPKSPLAEAQDQTITAASLEKTSLAAKEKRALRSVILKPDISILVGLGHFYFGLT